MGLGKAGAGWGHSLGDAGSCPSRLPGASSSCPLPPVLDPRQAVGLDRLLFLSSSLWAELLTPVRAVGLALPLWLPGVEDRPGQENSQARGPWHSPPTGSRQAFLPWQGEWALLGPRVRPGSAASARLPCCCGTLGLGVRVASLAGPGQGCSERCGRSVRALLRPAKGGHAFQRAREAFLALTLSFHLGRGVEPGLPFSSR